MKCSLCLKNDVLKINTKPVMTNFIQIYAPTAFSTEKELESFNNDLEAVNDKMS